MKTKLGHACGHNIIGTASTGAALALRSVLDRLSGRVLLIGTPAEESGGGKIILLENGVFDDVDFAMLVHPATQTMTRRASLAASRLKLEYFGRAAHASSAPEDGINALDACIQTFNSVNALHQHLGSEIRIHGILTHGGDAVNIVPAYAAAESMVRAAQLAQVSETRAKVIRAAESASAAMGATLKVTRSLDYAEMLPNITLADLYAENISALGETVIEAQPGKGRASSDMGNISQALPSIQANIKIAERGIAPHTTEFQEAAISDLGNQGLIKAAKALAMTAVDLLSNPDIVTLAQEEFASQMADS